MSRKVVAVWLVAVVVALCAWPVAIFSMKHYLPEVDNDEVMYFLLVKVFRSQGFHGGYSFVNDRIPASSIHFDMHGPGTVLLYSQLARLVGWTNYSPYLANLLLFVPSWGLLAYALRRRPENQIAAAAFVLANGYLFTVLPSAMQESFHISVAIAAAALWFIAVDRESRAAWIGLGVLLAAAILVRYSWTMAVPVVVFSFLMQRMKTWRADVGVPVAAAVARCRRGSHRGGHQLLLWWALPRRLDQSAGSACRAASEIRCVAIADNLSARCIRFQSLFAGCEVLFLRAAPRWPPSSSPPPAPGPNGRGRRRCMPP